MWKKYSFYLKGLDCANCARELEENLNKRAEYQNVRVDFSKLKITLESNFNDQVKEHLQRDITFVEPAVLVLEEKSQESYLGDLGRILFGTIFFIFSCLLSSGLSIFLLICSYFLLGYKTLWKAIRLLKQGILNENFLIVISAIGAFMISKANEGFMVLFLYEIGKLLEKKATGSVRKNVEELMDLKPEIAHRKNGDSYDTIRPEEVCLNDTLVLLKGEKLAVDCVLLSDQAEFDTSSLTGESRVQLIKKNELVLSGSINVGDVVLLSVTSEYENSTVKRILDLMENATDKKTKTENFVNRASRYYTPIMMLLAFLVFILSPFLFSISYQESLYRALMILVVSCPCAIAISVPLCYFAGLGSMSKHGILVKGSNYIDALSQMKHIVFDKTGTLTTGDFGITSIEILDSNYQENDLIRYLIYGEHFSTHPLAKSICQKYSSITVPKIKNIQEYDGRGISYEYQKEKVKLGNAMFVGTSSQTQNTAIYISVNDHVIGYVTLGDEVKDEAYSSLQDLKKCGISLTLFTGDQYDTAGDTAQRLDLDSFEAELLPDDKFHAFELMKQKYSNDIIAFVGDGINDSPVLRLSDCGIAMGSGAASSIEASDVVIMSSNLNKIVESYQIARKTIRILKQNLIFAIGIKVLVLLESFFGFGTMWLAVFADVGVTLLTILNSLRILYFNLKKSR